MLCPVCSESLPNAGEVLNGLDRRFAPCPDCATGRLDPRIPPHGGNEPCTCGRRSIDHVMAAIHAVFVDEGRLAPQAPLAGVGSPLLHPLFPMSRLPFLPPGSLILLSRHATPASARRLLLEIPELKGVVLDRHLVPGVGGTCHELLAGCDLYAEARFTPGGPLVLFKQVSTCHIEAPHPYDPKVDAVDRAIRRGAPAVFVDACSGAGTLGLFAALRRVPRVVLNDIWGPAAWFAGLNLLVNRESLLVDEVELVSSYADLGEAPPGDPLLVAEASGIQEVRVYHANLWDVPPLLPASGKRLAVLDPFDKDPHRSARITRRWQVCAGGEVFIP